MKKFFGFVFALLTVMFISTSVSAEELTKEPPIDDALMQLVQQDDEIPEHAQHTLIFTGQPEGEIRPLMDFPGNSGVLSLWDVGTQLHWKITMTLPATSVVGTLSITNLTSGLSSGRYPIDTFSGSVPYGAKFNNRYGASLYAQAYMLGKKVGESVPNYYTWIVK